MELLDSLERDKNSLDKESHTEAETHICVRDRKFKGFVLHALELMMLNVHCICQHAFIHDIF